MNAQYKRKSNMQLTNCPQAHVRKKIMFKSSTLMNLCLSAALTFFSGAGFAKSEKPDGYISADDLFIVDCLLPGQVRNLGRKFSYVAPRRPIRTTANDCAIRGGEYVAYDRANYATALKVWMPQAEQGDAQAQVYVGEIYEQGLGIKPDYEVAAMWYEKAATQGSSRAQINLGSLYERGLGVPQNTVQAMNWYRKASGIDDGVLELTTEAELVRRRQIEEDRARLRQRVMELRQELDAARAEIQQRQSAIDSANAQIASLTAEIRSSNNAEVAAQVEELQLLREAFRQQTKEMQVLRQNQSELQARASADNLAADSAALEKSDAENALKRSELKLGQAQQEIALLRSRLGALVEGSAEHQRLNAQLQDQEAELAILRTQYQSQKDTWQQALAEAEQKLSTARANQATLNAELDAKDQRLVQVQQALRETEQKLASTQDSLKQQSSAAARIVALEQQVLEREREIAQLQAGSESVLGQIGVTTVAAAGSAPVIDIISPPVALTRGVKGISLYSDVEHYEIVARVSPPDQLRLLRVNDQNVMESIDEHGFFQVNVPVTQSETPVAVEAVMVDGTQAQQSFTLLKEVSEPAMARNVSRLIQDRLRNDLGEFYALVIGNTEYAGFPDLQSAGNDASAIAGLLRDQYGYKTEVLLNADRDTLVAAFARYNESMGSNDNLLVYYAGHGTIDETSNDGYWLPTDAQPEQSNTWVSNTAITKFISEMEAKHVLVVADSCYSGTLTGNAIHPIPDSIEDEDLLFISRVKARTVLTSGGLQPVLDSVNGSNHSIFAQAFMQALQQNGNVMEGYRLFQSLRQEVQSRSRAARLVQTPQYSALQHAGHEGSEFFFLPVSDNGGRANSAMR